MENCVFCALVDKRIKPWDVLESESCLAFLDNRPIAPYHTLVIPKAHYENMLDVPAPVLQDITGMIHQICQLYGEKLGIDSFQIFNNTGPHSAQSVFHIHFHVVPRFKGDVIQIYAKPMHNLVDQYPDMLEKLK
ncbi:MAG: HIT family protein [Anaerolineaceae bacterium]|jgi:histidine triad (HIT) family protein